jgi:toxin-antitoxin system PIN domain toxin
VSVTVDANLLLYASDVASTFHERALETLRKCAEGSEILYVFWPVAMAYLRIATHPVVFEHPLSPDHAIANVDALLSRANVRAPGEDDGFWATFRAVTEGAVVRGNLVPDAHLVALMRQYGVQTIVSHDRDFHKFDGIRVHDPFK